MLCALAYLTPKFNEDFIQDFVFLSGILPRFDSVLILGNFNIHVCCYQKPLVRDFLNLIDSVNLVQSVNRPTHERRSSLSCGLQLCDIQICKFNFWAFLAALYSIHYIIKSVFWSFVFWVNQFFSECGGLVQQSV